MYLELVTNERAAAVRVLEQYAENGDACTGDDDQKRRPLSLRDRRAGAGAYALNSSCVSMW